MLFDSRLEIVKRLFSINILKNKSDCERSIDLNLREDHGKIDLFLHCTRPIILLTFQWENNVIIQPHLENII